MKFAPPDIADIPHDENRNHILLGRRLLAQTRKSLPENVGNGLNCTNRQLGEGRVAPAFDLWLVRGRLRHARSETSESAAGGVGSLNLNPSPTSALFAMLNLAIVPDR